MICMRILRDVEVLPLHFLQHGHRPLRVRPKRSASPTSSSRSRSCSVTSILHPLTRVAYRPSLYPYHTLFGGSDKRGPPAHRETAYRSSSGLPASTSSGSFHSVVTRSPRRVCKPHRNGLAICLTISYTKRVPSKIPPAYSTRTVLEEPLMARFSRRRFLEDSLLAAAAAAAVPVTSAFAGEKQSSSPNEKLGVAVVGCGGRGGDHLQAFAARKDAEVLYVVDPDEKIGAPEGRAGRQEAGPQAAVGGRHAQGLRRQVGRPGFDRHAQPLALAGRLSGRSGRQGRLRREARSATT